MPASKGAQKTTVFRELWQRVASPGEGRAGWEDRLPGGV